MAAHPIDYAALAAQARGGGVDYAALAQQARGGGNPARPAGLPEGVKLPGVPDAPLPNDLRSILHNPANTGIFGRGGGLQDSFDKNTRTSPTEPLLETGLKSFVSGAGGPLVHPVEAVKGIGKTILSATPLASVLPDSMNVGKQAAQGAVQDYKDGGLGYATTKQAGSALGSLALGKALSAAVPAAGTAASVLGDSSQDSGVGLLNRTIGALKPDFRRGANPARGYLNAGGKPALSMQGLADQSADLKADVGAQIPKVLASSSEIVPTAEVAKSLAKPILKAMELERGPGGMGNTGAIENYAAGFRPVFKSGVQNGGLTPLEVYELKRSIAQNTNWSDPTQFNLKAVRQQQAGALSGLTSKAVPEVAPLNQQYGDLTKFAMRAGTRAETGSMPLTDMIYKTAAGGLGAAAGALDGHPVIGGLLGAAADSVPVKSLLSYGMFRGGRGLSSVGRGVSALPSLDPAALAVPAYNLTAKKKAEGQKDEHAH